MAKKFYDKFINGRGLCLILGDGDFSFTKKLVQVCNQTRVCASNAIVSSTFPMPETLSTLKYLNRQNILRVNLDATLLHQWKDIKKFKVLIWNFPYPNRGDDYTTLLHQFFSSADQAETPVIVLGLKAIPEEPDHQYDRWDVLTIAQSYGYDLTSKSDVTFPFWSVTHVNRKRLRSTKYARHYELTKC